MSHNMDGLNKLRELIEAEKPFTDAEAIVKAFEAQGCVVTHYGEEGAWDEYDIQCQPFEGTFMSITLWPLEDGRMHFSLFVDAIKPGVEFTVDDRTMSTDELGVTLGPLLHVKEHGKITIKGKFEERELTW